MTALAWPPSSSSSVQSQPWRRCVSLSLASATLAAAIVLGAALLGWSWADAGAIGVGGVGTWNLATATTGLRQVFAGRSAELGALSHIAPALGLGLNVLAVTVARTLGGPALLVLGCVDIVVANVVVGASAAMQAHEGLGPVERAHRPANV